MSQAFDFKDADGSIGGYGSSHEKGSRRRKITDYLKAANELRQSYQQAYGLGGQHDGEMEGNGVGAAGANSDAAVVRADDEEMVLFPSYARQHHVKTNRQLEAPGATQDLRNNQDSGDYEYWRREWTKYEDENSIVDVDVRGWVYAPHRGAMTRKNRVLLGLARHLSGIPTPAGGGASGLPGNPRGKPGSRTARYDEELMEKEAVAILNRGEAEEDCAQQGRYSEQPTGKTQSPGQESNQRKSPLRLSSISSRDMEENAPGPGLLSKIPYWNQPADMTPNELAVANAHLMARLKPFLTTPLVSIPVSIFFYNDKTSKSRTITTDDSGHFSLRAALDFVPSHVRVLASEKLSATEEVRITEPTGVSMISDIDDTIKHSGIGTGAKEIFRNVFIRDLGDLTIDGVKEWYSKMSDLGVKFHYVSNSPWQLYPLLVSFFAGAGLPKGSFHLKQYSGMLQGIFEPVAERKKGTLERIMQDFPKRRFILVGDSGEADLELYTELLISNPGRILGVFIRDVTTAKPQGFFDSSMSKLSNGPGSQSSWATEQRKGSDVPRRTIPAEEKRPTLPSRQQTRSTGALRSAVGGRVGGAPTPNTVPRELCRSMTESTVTAPPRKSTLASAKSRPTRPMKPLALRGQPGEQQARSSPVPSDVKPRKPLTPLNSRAYSASQERSCSAEHGPLSQNPRTPTRDSRDPSAEPQGYRSIVINKVASTYHALPAWSNPLSTQQQPAQNSQPRELPSRPKPPTTPSSNLLPPIPSRRNISSYPAAAAHYATTRIGGGWSGYNADASPDDINGNATNPINKKEDLWNRRWARAKEIFDAKGVLLKTWRVGADVIEDATALVEQAGQDR
jgi:phosphatidate phosphatase APP1